MGTERNSSDGHVRPLSPSIHLAAGVGPPEAFEKGLSAPSAHLVPRVHRENVQQQLTDALSMGNCPALLVSYFYLGMFLKNRHRYYYRDWVMDSGAFSAYNSGAVIVLQDYIDCCKELQRTDPKLTEVYALDVIGSWEDSLRNTVEMWSQGVEAIPCFHYGEPWEVLLALCKEFPKVAIGGCVGRRDKDVFAGQCFARVWPKKLHGFGFGSEKSLMMYPWHSVDATNWEIAPCKYGHWKAFGGQRVSVRGSQQNLRAEVEWYLDLERRAQVRWKKEMELLKEVAPTIRRAYSIGLCQPVTPPTVYLGAARWREQCRDWALQPVTPPTVYLGAACDDVTERRPTAFKNPGPELTQ